MRAVFWVAVVFGAGVVGLALYQAVESAAKQAAIRGALADSMLGDN